MLLLVGLGNPGSKYAGNRHNVGFKAVDEIHRRFRFASYRVKFEGDIADGDIDGVKVLLLKPSTFMNESGRSVGAACRFYKIDAEDVFVLHDELDIVLGKLRVKTGGGLAGHNGLKSIAQHIGPDFCRVRIGIGHPGDRGRVTGHVLSDFSKADGELVEKIVDGIADAAPYLVQGKESEFMSKAALIINPPKPKKTKPEAEQEREQ